ncbi:MAG: TonB-dependent receptor [Elusimicrobia bacterium]|nr:TonB-dependent receptor [Elusimicrobiota bacterium]
MPGKTRSYIAFAALVLSCGTAPSSAQQSAYLSVEAARRPYIQAQDPVGTVELTQQELEERNAETAGQLLESVPSAALKKGGAPGLMEVAGLNGFSSKNTAVLYNGKKLAPDLSGTTDLSALNPASLSGLAVFSGPVSPLYGANAQGGVISLRGADPLAPDGAAGDFSTGDFDSSAYSVWARGGKGPLRLAVTGGRRYSDGFQQNGDYSGNDFSAALNAAPEGFGSVRFEAMRSFMANGIPGGTPVPIGEWDGYKERQANSVTDRQEDVRELFSASYASPEDRPVRIGVEGWQSTNDLTAWQYGSETRINTALNAVKVTAGLSSRTAFILQYEANKLTSNTYGNHMIYTRSAGGETRLDLSSELEAVLGAKLDSSGNWADQFNPRAVLVWRPLPGWKFSATAGRAWQAPTFGDMYNPWAPANPDLKPERSWQYEAGAQWEQLGGFKASLTAFYADLRDKIALDPNNGYAAYNLDQGRNAGVQPSVHWRNDSSRHTLSYAFIYSEGKQPGQNWRKSAYNPVQRLSYAGAFDLSDKLTANVFLRHVGEQFTGAGQTGIRLPEFTTADAGFEYKSGRYGLGFSVNNLTDQHYAENADAFNGYFPMPGRTFRLKLSVALNG